jgi:TadE-like protein
MLSLFRRKSGKKGFLHRTQNERGQSFVELSLVVIFLMIFVAGVVEFGFMLNNYLNLVDASREAVRYSSNFDPFNPDGSLDENFFNETFRLTEEVLAPVVLDSSKGDDIVVSFFSVADGYYRRYPNDQGRSRYLNQVSKLSNAEIQSRLDSSAPPTGVLLVEIFYHYSQLLHLPIFTMFVQDPMPVYVYAIMPLAAAEPPPTPAP